VSELSFRVVIPARYESTRFPGKALALLHGRPLIQHVYERAISSGACEVFVATDDRRIERCARDFGAEVERTRGDHPSGSDRVAEVAATQGWPDADIVVNVQGDVPLVPPGSIDQVAELLAEHGCAAIATLRTPIARLEEYFDPNVVKLVCDSAGRALYFSRAPIPSAAHAQQDEGELPQAWRHIGLYGYRVGDLRRLTSANPCYLEQAERLEQLRALWLGMEIRVGIAREAHGPDVDTPEDLEAAARYVAG